MDDATIADREFHERRRKPIRVQLPAWASILVTVVVLAVAIVALKPKRTAPQS